MDKIRIDIFDILGYLVPGSALLMIVWIAADSQVKSIWHCYQSLHGVDEKSIYTGLFLSYFLGFILHILGASLYEKYQKWNKRNNIPQENLTIAEKWTLIREFGEKHIHILERWYALRAFSQNLSAIALIFFVISLYKYFTFGYSEWLIVSLFSIFFFIVLIKRAAIFHDILSSDMESVIKKLHLSEK